MSEKKAQITEAIAQAHIQERKLNAALGSARARSAWLEGRLNEARDILMDIASPVECRLDHHGYCQAHDWMSAEICPHRRAQILLSALDFEE